MGTVHVPATPLVVLGLLELKTSLPGVCIHFPRSSQLDLILLIKAWGSRPEPFHDVWLFASFNLKGRDWEMVLLVNAAPT